MDGQKIISFLVLFALITLILGIARQLSEQNIIMQFPSSLNYLLPSSGGEEGFENMDPNMAGLYGQSVPIPYAPPLSVPQGQESSAENVTGKLDGGTNRNPADPELVDVRKPYSLLADVLKIKQTSGTLTAKTCFDKDFMAHTERTGNYIQRTNNYVHGAPDNCSTPYTEFVDSYYKNP